MILYATAVTLKNIKKRKEIAIANKKLEEENRIYNEENTKANEKNEFYSTLETLGDIFYSMHVIDIKEDTVVEFNARNEVKSIVNQKNGAVEMMKKVMEAVTSQEYKEAAFEFTDLNTLAERMKNKKIISGQFIGKNIGWFLASFLEA